MELALADEQAAAKTTLAHAMRARPLPTSLFRCAAYREDMYLETQCSVCADLA
jgi:hypothetical protein